MQSASGTQRVLPTCPPRAVAGTHMVMQRGAAHLQPERGRGKKRRESGTQRVRLSRLRRAVGGTDMVLPHGAAGTARLQTWDTDTLRAALALQMSLSRISGERAALNGHTMRVPLTVRCEQERLTRCVPLLRRTCPSPLRRKGGSSTLPHQVCATVCQQRRVAVASSGHVACRCRSAFVPPPHRRGGRQRRWLSAVPCHSVRATDEAASRACEAVTLRATLASLSPPPPARIGEGRAAPLGSAAGCAGDCVLQTREADTLYAALAPLLPPPPPRISWGGRAALRGNTMCVPASAHRRCVGRTRCVPPPLCIWPSPALARGGRRRSAAPLACARRRRRIASV
jgi:hypothetical protein